MKDNEMIAEAELTRKRNSLAKKNVLKETINKQKEVIKQLEYLKKKNGHLLPGDKDEPLYFIKKGITITDKVKEIRDTTALFINKD